MFLPSADRYRLFQYAVVIGFGSAGDFWSSSAAQSSSVAVGVSLHASPILTWQFGSGAPRSSSVVFGSYASDDSVLDLNVCSPGRSEEHTSELQSLMRTSYAVFCLK